ncbi:MAG: hypothetical protein DWQ04_21165 [Chloroflexi bacterium]|nr:MAG: hypothetical protein DWQ04_21165 [Chloroflexota bacterium]
MKQIFTRFSLALVAMILFGLFLTACGGGDDETPPADTPTDTPVDTPAEDPTDEPAPTDTPVPPTETPVPPTATPEPSPTPEPSAGFVEFESPEGGFKISHPDGWFNSELFGLAIFASAEELLDSPDPGEEGGVMVVISGPTEDFENDFGSLDPVVVLSEGAGELGLGEDSEIVEGPTATTINGVDAATAVINSTSDNGTPLITYLVILIDETRGAVAFGATPSESAEEFMPIFETMATTIELMEPTAAESIPDIGDNVEILESEGILLFGDQVTSVVPAGGSSAWDFLALEGEVVDIVVAPQTEDLDAVVDVVNESGTSILPAGAIDDSFDEESILELEIPADGTYQIIVTGFSDADAGEYQITFSESGVVAPTSEGSTVIDSMNYNEIYTGSFTGEESSIAVLFSGNAGDISIVTVVPDEDLDVIIDIIDADGNSLIPEGKDNYLRAEAVAAQLPANGEYSVVVTTFEEGMVGDFEVFLEGPSGTVVFAGDTLENVGDEHFFPFEAEENETVFILVEPEGELDVVVGVYSDDNDDEELASFDRHLGTEGFGTIISEDGDYYFRISGYDPEASTEDGGESTGSYFVSMFGTERIKFDLAYNDTVQGRFDTNDGFIDYNFNGAAGETVNLTLETSEESDGVLEILDLDGNELASADDGFAGDGEVLSYTFVEDIPVILRVRDFSAAGGFFELLVDAG